jgi:AcrR family transcriptional regulator
VTARSLREERSEETRRALLRSARRLFAKPGYSQTTVEDVAARARVTIGALYHHFRNKRELMAAVFEEIEAELMATVARAAASKRSPIEQVRAAFSAFLEACDDRSVRRIAFEEAPAALGWEAYREIDERYALGALKQALHALRQAKLLRRFEIDLLAQVLLAALVEAGIAMSRSDDPDALRLEARRILDALLDGLTSS